MQTLSAFSKNHACFYFFRFALIPTNNGLTVIFLFRGIFFVEVCNARSTRSDRRRVGFFDRAYITFYFAATSKEESGELFLDLVVASERGERPKPEFVSQTRLPKLKSSKFEGSRLLSPNRFFLKKST